MQTVLAMVAKSPVLQKPNALFTLCTHQKSITKYSWGALRGFFCFGRKKKKELSNHNKGVCHHWFTGFHLTLHFFQFTNPRQACALSTTNWLFFLYSPVSEQTLTFIPVTKKKYLFWEIEGRMEGKRAIVFPLLLFTVTLKNSTYLRLLLTYFRCECWDKYSHFIILNLTLVDCRSIIVIRQLYFVAKEVGAVIFPSPCRLRCFVVLFSLQ